MSKRVIVTGDRHWYCEALAGRVMPALMAKYGPEFVLVHGMATGVDLTFAGACVDRGGTQEPHPADWDAHGRAAGPRRNAEMVVAGAMFCLAVHRDLARSRGTRDCVRRCLAAGIPVWLIDSDDAPPRRITEVP